MQGASQRVPYPDPSSAAELQLATSSYLQGKAALWDTQSFLRNMRSDLQGTCANASLFQILVTPKQADAWSVRVFTQGLRTF